MNRIAIIGNAGGGKSKIAERYRNERDIAVTTVDELALTAIQTG